MPTSTFALTQIHETVSMLRRGHAEENNPTDFEADAPSYTNRGNKLKRKAQAYHEGQLGGQRAFKKRIDHAGFDRYILHSNPRRYDNEGYELDAEDEDPEADEDAAERNPYDQIVIQDLLMPLTSASELEQHPTLSLPYKSDILPNMVRQARNMLHKERSALVNLKFILTRLRGDHTWIPCGDVYSENDADIFVTDIMPELVDRIEIHKPNGELRISLDTENSDADHLQESANRDNTAEATWESQHFDALEESGRAIDHFSEAGERQDSPLQKTIAQDQEQQVNQESSEAKDVAMMAVQTNPSQPDEESMNPAYKVNEDTLTDLPEQTKHPSQPPEETEAAVPNASPRPRMLTRHQAQAQASQSQPQPPPTHQADPLSSPALTSTSSTLPTHPLFTVPPSAIPDKDFGLPDAEAEDTRRVLSALVQKQEEVVRGASQLYEGLLRADRLAKTVWKWCKAEGHVDEMSDGEDWVDLEEWGLDGMLKKGMEEAEGDGTGNGGAGSGGHGVSAKEGTGPSGGAGGATTTGEKRSRGRKGG